MEDENGEEPKEDDSMELVDDTVPEEGEMPTQSLEEASGSKKRSEDESERASGETVAEEGGVELCVEVDGDKVDTLGAVRGNETTFHTVPGEVMTDICQQKSLSPEDYCAMRSELERQLATWSQVCIMDDSHEHFIDAGSSLP